MTSKQLQFLGYQGARLTFALLVALVIFLVCWKIGSISIFWSLFEAATWGGVTWWKTP